MKYNINILIKINILLICLVFDSGYQQDQTETSVEISFEYFLLSNM